MKWLVGTRLPKVFLFCEREKKKAVELPKPIALKMALMQEAHNGPENSPPRMLAKPATGVTVK
ncbi:MAG: hypothetical protein HYW50_03115, partial [Candidatus Diapherotrites archaeon]|nr:hypothetical protein [Candidatus Diapherotrites archaeon]